MRYTKEGMCDMHITHISVRSVIHLQNAYMHIYLYKSSNMYLFISFHINSNINVHNIIEVKDIPLMLIQ